jgi:large subunit ribosomal protein L25
LLPRPEPPARHAIDKEHGMTDYIELKTETRDVIGKANRRLAEADQIPGVLYGYQVEPTTLAIDRHTFEYLMSHAAITSTVIRVRVDGGDEVNAIVKEIQEHPVSGSVLHVDLLAIDMTKRIVTMVPLHLVGEAAGSEEGGVVTQMMTEVEVEALPSDLPDYLEADISPLEIGDGLHVSDLIAPEEVDILSDPKSVIVSITLPRQEEEEEELEEELLEVPEIGEEGEEGEEGAAAAEEGEGAPAEETEGE